ncbi:MAG: hrpA [Phycisphaerales bacterium]|nr:hrpA [Phycisphaerales bacterium]
MPRLPEEISLAKSEAIHRALLTGLLANVGAKAEAHEFNGTRGTKFNIFPGSSLFKRNPQWVMAAELVETTRLYARTVAPVRPEWVERLGAHLVKRTYSEPLWQPETAHVMATEKVSLYSLVLVAARRVHYGPIDPRTSREIFIQHALAMGEFRTAAPFLRHNLALVAEVERMEAKARRKDLMSDVTDRFKFFDARVPEGIYNGPLFERWRKDAEKTNPKSLFMSLRDVLAPGAEPVPAGLYPDEIALEGLKLNVDYRFDTGSPADGMTVNIPIAALSQVPAERFEWLAPGYLPDKIEELIRSLPKDLRKSFIPIGDAAREAAAALTYGAGSLYDGLALFLGKRAGAKILLEAFNIEGLPPYLRMNFRVLDAAGKQIAIGRDLAQIRADLQVEVRSSFANLPRSEHDRDNLVRWDFGDLPERVPVHRHGMTLWGYPALIDRGTSASIRLLESPEAAREATRGGARRLFMLQLQKEIDQLARRIPNIEQMCLNFSTVGNCDELKRDLMSAIVGRALFHDGEDVRTQAEFIRRATDGWRRLSITANELTALADQILTEYQALNRELSRVYPPLMQPAARDMRDQLAHLVFRGFLSHTPHEWVGHLPRYLKAMNIRLRKLNNAGLNRDTIALDQVAPLWEDYKLRATGFRRVGKYDASLVQFRWMMEELRVSLFAQELKAAVPVSVQRLEKLWEQVPLR